MYDIVEKLLAERGITATKLARELGLSQSTFSAWKRGEYIPKVDKRKKVADYFGVTLDYLDGVSDRPHGDFTNAKPVSSVEMISIPVLKEIPNGIDVAAVTSTNGNIMIKKPTGGGTYWGLQIEDDSMFPMIIKNDVVIIKEQDYCNENSISVFRSIKTAKAVVRKFIAVDNQAVIFQALNSTHKSFYFNKPEQYEIIGVVVGLHRDFKSVRKSL